MSDTQNEPLPGEKAIKVKTTCVFQNAPFWGVWSKASALQYVRRKAALQVQRNPPQPRAKRTTPPDVKIVTLHHAHNNFFFLHGTYFDTHATTMRFRICVLKESELRLLYYH